MGTKQPRPGGKNSGSSKGTGPRPPIAPRPH